MYQSKSEEWGLVYFPKYGPGVIVDCKGELKIEDDEKKGYSTLLALDLDTMSSCIEDTILYKTDYKDLEGFWVWEGTAEAGMEWIGIEAKEYTIGLECEWRRPTEEELDELKDNIPTHDS